MRRKNVIDISIIGFGPRGLSIFERIIAYVKFFPTDQKTNIHIFETQGYGHGSHPPDQPAHLLVNTVASQITMFADDSVRSAGPVLEGPDFHAWVLSARGTGALSADEETFFDENGVDPDAYYPRSTFGKYLDWVYEFLAALRPESMTITFYREAACDMQALDGERYRVCGENGASVEADYVFLTTGHSLAKRTEADRRTEQAFLAAAMVNPKLQFICDPYPIADQLRDVSAGVTVLIEGAGLTAFDALSELTIGRGGRFERRDGELTYLPSGREPRIVVVSRSGLPLTARGVNQKGQKGRYESRFLTFEAVRRIRARKHRLDFNADVMPLLLLDMEHAYYRTAMLRKAGDIEAYRFSVEFVTASPRRRAELLDAHFSADERFSWDSLANPTPRSALESRSTYAYWLRCYLADDIASGREGNIDSPIKAATDVLRDVRDVLRDVIDFGGLTAESHSRLTREFTPLMIRLAVGPPLRRVEELACLIDFGVVDMSFGPSPTVALNPQKGKVEIVGQCLGDRPVADADVLYRARLPIPGPQDDASPLAASLLARGLVRPFKSDGYAAGGVEVNGDLNVIDAESRVRQNFWALGPVCEGVKFYTFVVPRPGVNSTAVVDAGRAVGRLFDADASLADDAGAAA